MVKTFVCPKDAGIPTSVGKLKSVHNDDDSGVSYGKYKKGSSYHQKLPLSDRQERQEEVKGLMNEVKNLSSQTLSGLKKKKNKDDVLTRLGVDEPKQQTMPFKMALGIRDGRKKRMIKEVDRSKESGVILNKSMTYKAINEINSSSKGNKKRAREEQKERHGGLDIGTKQGVFRLKKSKLSPGLI